MANGIPGSGMAGSIGKAGALLRSLVPRAQVFCYYDTSQTCAWSSDDAEDYEVDSFVADLPRQVIAELGGDNELLRRTLSSGRTLLALPVQPDEQDMSGLLVVLFSKNDGKSSALNPSLLKTILEPAVALIAESIRIAGELNKLKNSSEGVERELGFVYEIDEKIHGASGRHSNLAHLVGRSGRFLGINYSVLLIPSKRIRISATHSTWKSVNRKVLDRYLVEQLLPRLDGQRNPMIFEIPAVEGEEHGPKSGYQALLCPLLDSQGNVEGILAQLGRVDQSAFTRNDRRFMSHISRKVEYVIEHSFDAMTGLMNRAGFEAQLTESFATLENEADAHQIVYFDLDNLQLVNDSFSRKAGDELIMRFARLLEENLPNTGVLSRLTGDDFCMLLTNATTDEALAFASEVRERTAALRYLEGDKSLQVTISVGIAEFNRHSGNDGSALTTARMACEAAKEQGRDRIEVFDDGNRSVVRRYDDMQLVAAIQRALDGDEFEMLAQPIDALAKGGEHPYYEVLLRMEDGEGGYVDTAALFSAAERYRMMPAIDRWVISNTIANLGQERDAIEQQSAVFAINLSGQSLGDDDIFEFIESELKQNDVPATALCFEITESAAVSNLRKAQAFIDSLQAVGCTISLDDFGAGLSSFAYLKNFNVDTLKIDGGFIHDITENRISESMVAAITQVAKVMQLKTVAEYVETTETRALITELGVDYAQGHCIGKPVPLRDVLSDLVNIPASSVG